MMTKTLKRKSNEDDNANNRNLSPKRICSKDMTLLDSKFYSKYANNGIKSGGGGGGGGGGGSSPYSPSQSFDEDAPYSPSQLNFEEPKPEKTVDLTMEMSGSRNCRIAALHRNLTEPELHHRIAEWVSNTTTECLDYNDARPTLFYGCAMTTDPRIIALRSENILEDPRIRLYSNRFRAKIRLLIQHKYSTCSDKIKSKISEEDLEKELDQLIECRGKASYWFRVIKFLNNPIEDIKEMSKLIVLSPKLSQVLRLSHRLPANIPTQPSLEHMTADPRLKRGDAYCSNRTVEFYPLRFTEEVCPLSNENCDRIMNGSTLSASIDGSDDLNSRSDA